MNILGDKSFLGSFFSDNLAHVASGLVTCGMSRRSSLASLLLERLEGEEEKEGKKKSSFPMPTMTDPFRVLGDEELPGWLGLPWSPKSWPPSSSSQVLIVLISHDRSPFPLLSRHLVSCF